MAVLHLQHNDSHDKYANDVDYGQSDANGSECASFNGHILRIGRNIIFLRFQVDGRFVDGPTDVLGQSHSP